MNPLKSSKLIFILSIIIALVFPQLAVPLKPYLVPILIVMMTFSLKDVCFQKISKKNVKDVVQLLLMNFLLLTPAYIILSRFLGPEYQAGVFMLGVMPPAVGIVALTFILKGNMEESLLAEFLGYLLSIVLAPLLVYFFLDSTMSPWHILKILLLVIILPFIISQLLHYLEKHAKKIKLDFDREAVNLCYGISFYIIIGINRSNLFNLDILWLLLVLTIFRFGLALIIFLIAHARKTPRQDIVEFVMFGTFKNGGAATAIVIILFGVSASIPLAVNAVVVPIYILFLEWFFWMDG